MLLLLGLLLSVGVNVGCLSHQYEISSDELSRLAKQKPEERGRRVRVLQQTKSQQDDIEEAPAFNSQDDGMGWSSGSDVSYHTVTIRSPRPATPPHPSTPAAPPNVRMPATPSLGSGVEGIARTPAAPMPAAARVPAAPGVGASGGGASRAVQRIPASPGPAKAKGGGSKSLPLDGGGDGKAAVVVAAVALVAAGGVMAAHASTEGKRYDGWVSMPVDQPVLVEQDDGTRYWVPLGSLSLADTQYADRGIVVEEDDELQRLGRAPLTRDGFVYSLEVGAAQTSARGGQGPTGFQSRVGLGGFLNQYVGLLGGAQFAAASDSGTVFNYRLMAELQVMPVHIGKVHLGVFGEAGYGWVMHDAPGRTDHGRGWTPGGGALLQYELTTRLAASLRGGVVRVPGVDDMDAPGWAPEVGFGLAVY